MSKSAGRVGSVALALLTVLVGCGGDPQRVSAREQSELPTSAYGLVQDLCFRGDSRIDRRYGIREANPRGRRQFAALERGMRKHPDAVVRVEFAPADSPEVETRELTVRELAENHLEGAKEGELPNEAGCYRRGRARLERLLNKTD
jgi:hypothetical protein